MGYSGTSQTERYQRSAGSDHQHPRVNEGTSMAKAKSTPLRTRRPLINLISVGDTFGLLTVTDIRRDRRESLVCRCECGAEVRRNASQLLIKKEWRHVRCAIQTNQRFFDRIIRVPSGCWEFSKARKATLATASPVCTGSGVTRIVFPTRCSADRSQRRCSFATGATTRPACIRHTSLLAPPLITIAT